MMKREAYLRVLARHVTNEIVVPTFRTASDWLVMNDRPLNFFSVGAMGLASSHGLGFAMAFPERRVLVLDGDGSLLMNLGTLVTIAGVRPKNLVHLISYNGGYEANGSQPLPNDVFDFVAMARAAGIPHCFAFEELAAFESKAGELLRTDGPVFGVVHVEGGGESRIRYEDMYSPARRAAFKEALGSPPS